MNVSVSKCKPAGLRSVPIRGLLRGRIRGLVLAGIMGGALSLATTACFTAVEPLPVVLWEVQMEGEVDGVGAVTASVAMVANDFVTQIGIGVQGGGAGIPLAWSVRQGTCEDPGSLVVDESLFEVLELDSEGAAAAELLVNRRVDIRAAYSAAISHPGGETLACRQLERLN